MKLNVKKGISFLLICGMVITFFPSGGQAAAYGGSTAICFNSEKYRDIYVTVNQSDELLYQYASASGSDNETTYTLAGKLSFPDAFLPDGSEVNVQIQVKNPDGEVNQVTDIERLNRYQFTVGESFLIYTFSGLNGVNGTYTQKVSVQDTDEILKNVDFGGDYICTDGIGCILNGDIPSTKLSYTKEVRYIDESSEESLTGEYNYYALSKDGEYRESTTVYPVKLDVVTHSDETGNETVQSQTLHYENALTAEDFVAAKTVEHRVNEPEKKVVQTDCFETKALKIKDFASKPDIFSQTLPLGRHCFTWTYLDCSGNETKVNTFVNVILPAPEVEEGSAKLNGAEAEFTLAQAAEEGTEFVVYQAESGMGNVGNATANGYQLKIEFEYVPTESTSYYIAQIGPDGLESQRAKIDVEVDCPLSVKENKIFANGVPITLAQGSKAGTTRILYGNGSSFCINGSEENDLSEYAIYGGAEKGSVDETKVSVTGGTMKEVYGGGYEGEVSGDTNITVTGGTIGGLFGGGASSKAVVWGKRNGFVLTDMKADNSQFDNLLLLSADKYFVYGMVELESELQIAENQKLEIQEGAGLSISRGNKLVNMGEILNAGILNVYGTLENHGTVISYEVKEGQAELTGYQKDTAVYNLPEKIDGKTVFRIGEGALAGAAGVEKIIIPACVSSIGEGAFRDSADLKEIIAEGNIIEIGNDAFTGTQWFDNEKQKNSVVIFCHVLIDGSAASGKLTVPAEVTSIADRAFYGCVSLTDIILPEKLTYIGEYAFAGSGLQSISLNGEIEEIKQGTFSNCKDLASISLPKSVCKIGYAAFESCILLKEIFLPKQVAEISPYSFYDCTGMVTIYYPEIAETGINAFPAQSARLTYSLTEQEEIAIEKIYPSAGQTELDLPGSLGGYPVTACSEVAYAQAAGLGLIVNHTCHYNEFHQCTICYTRHPDGIAHVYGSGNTCTICGIEKPKGEGSLQIANSKEGETIIPILSSSTNGTLDVQIFYKKKQEPDTAYTKEKPTAAGNYVAKAIFAATPTFQEVIVLTEFTIQKAGAASTALPTESPSATKKPTVTQKPSALKLSKTIVQKVNSPGKRKIRVTWKKTKNANGYTIQVSTSKKFKKKTTKTFKVSKKTIVSKTITKLKRKQRYYIRVRAYAKSGSKTITGAWSKMKKIRVK